MKIKFLLSLLCLFFYGRAIAHDFEVDGFYYNITSLADLTVALTGNENNTGYDEFVTSRPGNSYSGAVVVPSKVEWNGKTFTVTEIQGEAFFACTLTSLVVPNTVKRLHVGNAKIGKLVIEDGEELLQASGYYVNVIGHIGGVDYNRGLGDEATIDEVYLGRNTDSYFSGGIEKVAIGEQVTFLSRSLFSGCKISGTFVLPENIKEIEAHAFASNVNLEAVEAVGVEKIGESAFSKCTKLNDFKMPNLKYIGVNAFGSCTSLKQFEIPQGVSTIGAVAFQNCENLESVVIPNSIIEFGSGTYFNTTYHQVFRGCTALKSITVNAKTPFVLDESNFDALTYVNAELHVPAEAVDAYKEADTWKNFFKISDGGISDDVCSVIVTGCSDSPEYDGCITIGEDTIRESEAVLTACVGDVKTFKFVPNPNYEIESVSINDKDVTSQIKDNELIVTITENMTLDVNWGYSESDPVLLTIKQADAGCVKMPVSEWDSYKFYIEAADGWKIHSVNLNGEDITDNIASDGLLRLGGIVENTVLSIAFEATVDVGVKRIDTNSVKVYGVGNDILVSGLKDNEVIQIYNDGGVLLRTLHANGYSMTIPMECEGVYIVKIGDKTVKVAL